MDEILFDLDLTLCGRFNLSPFQIRRETAWEVFRLLERLQNAKRTDEKKNGKVVTRGGRKVLLKPAGDDWF